MKSNNSNLAPVQNAIDSLTRMAGQLENAPKNDLWRMKGALVWGWHAVDLLAYLRLLPSRQVFDYWMQDYLNEGEPGLDSARYSHWDEAHHLSLLVLLDMFSEETLPILKPEFYHGWQERTSRCQSLRRRVAGVVGSSIGAQQRDQLLFLLAVYNHVFRLPAATTIDINAVGDAFLALLGLLDLLVDRQWTEADRLLQLIHSSYKQI